MRLRKHWLYLGLILVIPPIIVFVGALYIYSSLTVNQFSNVWNRKSIVNYTMTVTVLWLPVPASDVQVVIQNGKLTEEKLLECEVGQPAYSASTCKTLTTYYYRPHGDHTYTVDQLFQVAQSCSEKTKSVINKYSLGYQVGATGFTSSDAMYDFERTNWSSLTSSDNLCSVEYNAEYGYPEEIVQLTPKVMDGGSVIAVKNFHVDD